MGAYKLKGDGIRCVAGTLGCSLKVAGDHGVLVEGTPLANANDHMMGSNIDKFGNCLILTAASSGVPQPCNPVTPLAWMNAHSSYMIEGAPVLTEKSLLPCMLGGIIMFT